MNEWWLFVAVCGTATIALKAVGPGLLGGRGLPDWMDRPVALLAPALLAALIAVQVFGDGRSLVIDARLAGISAAALGLLARLPLLVCVVLAAAVTAGVRALT